MPPAAPARDWAASGDAVCAANAATATAASQADLWARLLEDRRVGRCMGVCAGDEPEGCRTIPFPGLGGKPAWGGDDKNREVHVYDGPARQQRRLGHYDSDPVSSRSGKLCIIRRPDAYGQNASKTLTTM